MSRTTTDDACRPAGDLACALRARARAMPQTAINSQRSLPAATEDQGAEVAADVRGRRRRTRCVPDRPVNGGNLRSLADSLMRRLTCG
jgi:hypothetical protein